MFTKIFRTRKFNIITSYTISSFSSLHTVQSTYVKVTHRKKRIILLLFCTKHNGACTKSPRSLTAPVSKTILDYLGPSYK
jgi:hypothetical protein